MSLTLKEEQRLIAVGLVAFFDKNKTPWITVAKQTYTFLKSQFPAAATVRRDDVAMAMVGVLEVNDALKKYLQTKKLEQLYWYRNFADLVLDRAWDQVIK
jgi:hypothetical protein